MWSSKKRNQYFKVVTCLMSFWLVSCGQERKAGSFDRYLIDFENYAKKNGQTLAIGSIEVKFGELEPQEYGRCTISQTRPPLITISEKRWKYELTEERREVLMLHELGHCVLGRKHDNAATTDTQGRPVSIMHKYLLDGQTYQKNKDDYLKEMFKPALQI